MTGNPGGVESPSSGNDGPMSLVRFIARPLLSSMFVVGGISSLRAPETKTGPAERFSETLHRLAPSVPSDPALLVRVNGAIHVGAGLMLATNRFSRLASFVLASTLVPTTLYAHAYWQESDPARKAQQKVNFFKNLSMMGGLLVASVDTEGRPGLAWRAKHAVGHLTDSSERIVHDANREAHLLAAKAQLKAHEITS